MLVIVYIGTPVILDIFCFVKLLSANNEKTNSKDSLECLHLPLLYPGTPASPPWCIFKPLAIELNSLI